MIEHGSAHDRGECLPLFCAHPDHFVTDAEVDLDLLIHQQLESGEREALRQGFVDLT